MKEKDKEVIKRLDDCKYLKVTKTFTSFQVLCKLNNLNCKKNLESGSCFLLKEIKKAKKSQ